MFKKGATIVTEFFRNQTPPNRVARMLEGTAAGVAAAVIYDAGRSAYENYNHENTEISSQNASNESNSSESNQPTSPTP